MTIPFGYPGLTQQISVVNWPEAFPYTPDVKFTIWHDGKSIHLEYNVMERCVKAEQTELGMPVYCDSCVEFFIQPDPDDPRYYNFEWNAAGLLAMACRTGRNDPQSAPLEVLKSVRVEPSLGVEPFPERAIDSPWTLKAVIPVTAFFNHEIDSLSGRNMRINLYKCGDGLSSPHYISWKPVQTESPDFHRPEFFETVRFGL